ncbi:MAG: hypothetical protein KGJ25_12445, partial [Betaproteobacteria bacterium]|nr:hypothetical protein [Betaproteobacteria bacterium]
MRSTRSSSSTCCAFSSPGGTTRAGTRRCRADAGLAILREPLMSHFLDRITYFSQAHEDFADGHGRTTG